jgi:hypothetical protein
MKAFVASAQNSKQVDHAVAALVVPLEGQEE